MNTAHLRKSVPASDSACTVLSARQAALLHALLPIAESISEHCGMLFALLHTPENEAICGDFLALMPPLMPASDGKIVADHPLHHCAGLFAQQLRFATEDCTANPAENGGCAIGPSRINSLVSGFDNMKRFVFQPLMHFDKTLIGRLIPSLAQSLGFGKAGTNATLLRNAQAIHQHIVSIRPLIEQATPLLEELAATLELTSEGAGQ